jgi:hypothetical protein
MFSFAVARASLITSTYCKKGLLLMSELSPFAEALN